MSNWSISFAYRLGLGFHALNNEGSDGSNLMQPRRIDLGRQTYDGISGEIIRRHILENFIRCYRGLGGTNILPLSEGLHPDRGPIGIRVAAKRAGAGNGLTNANLFESVRTALQLCAVLDVGGYLAAWRDQSSGAAPEKYVAEKTYIDAYCADYKDVDPVKRESCFDVAWLISDKPQSSTVTQHSAYRASAALNSRYSQTMRSNTYAGVIRADLHRVGTDDYWYLHGQDRLALPADEITLRRKALVQAIIDLIVSPTGAKVAAWAPHVFCTEGVVLLSAVRTAPFVSPILVDLDDDEQPIRANSNYTALVQALANGTDTWTWEFSNGSELIAAGGEIAQKLEAAA